MITTEADLFTQNKSTEMSPGYLRQRRNLLIISIVMPLFFLSKATVEKINLFGTTINIENPLAFQWFIVIFFIYFFWRYYIYRREDTRLEALKIKKLSFISRNEKNYFMKKAKRIMIKNNKDIEPTTKRADLYFSFKKNSDTGQEEVIPSIFNDGKINLLNRERQLWVCGSALDELYKETRTPDNKFNNEGVKTWELVHGAKQLTLKSAIPYNVITLLFLRQLSSVTFATNQSYFSDYNLPFLVALASLCATIYSVL